MTADTSPRQQPPPDRQRPAQDHRHPEQPAAAVAREIGERLEPHAGPGRPPGPTESEPNAGGRVSRPSTSPTPIAAIPARALIPTTPPRGTRVRSPSTSPA